MAIPKAKTELENFLVYGIDPKHRRIHFGSPLLLGYEDSGSFDQGNVEMAVRAIRRFQDDHPSKPIEIHMNSYGGDAYAMLYLIDVILSSSCQFKFYGGGAIMSAATWVMCVCDERYLYPNAVVMVHDGWDGGPGKHTDNQIDAAQDKELQDRLNEMFTENSFMPLKFWQDILQRDTYLTAQEAIQVGIADFMIQYTKRGNLRKKRQHRMSKTPNARTMKSLITKLYKRVKMNVPSKELKLHIPEPEVQDPNVVVDNTPIQEESGSEKD